MPTPSLPIDVEHIAETGHGSLYALWRKERIDVTYFNAWDSTTMTIPARRWCSVNGRERAIVGEGEICFLSTCITLK